MGGSRDIGRDRSSARSFLARIVAQRDTDSLTADDSTANETLTSPLGLTTLYSPPAESVVADLVFVHGLNGGSQSTWAKGNDPALFWPREWLPKDEAFRDVRIHTFGYASAISHRSILDVRDFAKSLLGSIKDCPAMQGSEKVRTPIDTIHRCTQPVAIPRFCLHSTYRSP